MLCALYRSLSPKSFQLVTTVPSCRASQPYCRQVPTLTPCHLSLPSRLSWRYGTAAWVSAVPSGDIGLLGRTASNFLHAVNPPLLNACRHPWRAAARYHLPWTPFAWPATPCPQQVLSCLHGKTCRACFPPNSMMMTQASTLPSLFAKKVR